jgi:hypothetical protein
MGNLKWWFEEAPMMRAWLLALLILLCSWEADADDRFRVGAWSGVGVNDPQTGQFERCFMSAKYDNGGTLLISILPDGSLSLIFYNPEWSQAPERDIDVVLSIDRYPPIHAPARSLDKQTIGIRFYDPIGVFDQLRFGNVLRLDLRNDRPGGFGLADSNRALMRLLSCAQRGMGYPDTAAAAVERPSAAGTQDAPRNSSAAVTSGSGGTGADDYVLLDRADLVVTATNLLSGAGISGFRILTESERKEIFPDYPVVWVGPGASFGALTGFRLAHAGTPLGDVINMVGVLTLSGDASACKGTFASGTRDEPAADGMSVKRVFTACKTSDGKESYLADYSIFGVGDDTIIKLAIATTGSEGDPDAEQEQLRDELDSSAVNALQSF